MRFYFSGYDFVGITSALEAKGHEIVSKGRWGDGVAAQPDAWWGWCIGGKRPSDFARYLIKRAVETEADVIVMGKIFHWNKHGDWFIPPPALQQLRRLKKTLVYVSWDDPDHLQKATQSGMLQHFHAIGSCCLDDKRSWDVYRMFARRAKLFDFWPGWDQKAWEPDMAQEQEPVVDLLIGGTPYTKPNYEYAGPPRRDIALAALERGWSLELWGPDSWTKESEGGSEKLAPYYKGSFGYRERGTLWKRARVNVDVHLRAPVPLYLNDRFFMLAGSGRPFVCDRQPGVSDVFPGVSYYEPGNLQDCMNRLDILLKNQGPAKAAAQKTRKQILAHHTLAHRVDAMLEAIGAL